MGKRRRDSGAVQGNVVDAELRCTASTIQVRCRGSCAHVQQPGVVSLEGEHIGVVVRKERCPQCDGRLMELYLHYAGRQRSGQVRWEVVV